MSYDVYFLAKSNNVITKDKSFRINEEQYKDIMYILNSNPEIYEETMILSDDDLR